MNLNVKNYLLRGKDDFSWVNKLLKPQINNFHLSMINFCNSHNLPISFLNYLTYSSSGGYIGDNFQSLYTAPKYYLICSRDFKKYYKQLDHDFANDILHYSLARKLKLELKSNNELLLYIKELLVDDFYI